MGELIAKYRIFRYLVTGVFTSSLDLVLFSVFSVVVRIPEVLSNVLSTLITVCISYHSIGPLFSRLTNFLGTRFSPLLASLWLLGWYCNLLRLQH